MFLEPLAGTERSMDCPRIAAAKSGGSGARRVWGRLRSTVTPFTLVRTDVRGQSVTDSSSAFSSGSEHTHSFAWQRDTEELPLTRGVPVLGLLVAVSSTSLSSETHPGDTVKGVIRLYDQFDNVHSVDVRLPVMPGTVRPPTTLDDVKRLKESRIMESLIAKYRPTEEGTAGDR